MAAPRPIDTRGPAPTQPTLAEIDTGSGGYPWCFDSFADSERFCFAERFCSGETGAEPGTGSAGPGRVPEHSRRRARVSRAAGGRAGA